MAEIAFNCPRCGHSYRFGPDLAGKRGRCKACQAVFRIPTAPPPPPPTDDGKIAFPCPHCGHSYRLDAKLAGKQARCTGCRAAFTIPSPSRPAAPSPSRPAAPSGGDSGFWELDSSESIPTTPARPAAARPRPAPLEAAFAMRDDRNVTAAPARPGWIVPAAIAGGGVIGLVVFAIVFKAVFREPEPQPPALAERPAAPAEPVVDGDEPEATPTPSIATADRHREAVEALVRSYEQIADGYARVRDARSIAEGRGPIDRGVQELRSASRRGKALPMLSPADRLALIRREGPRLIRAVERVLVELRRLQSAPDVRSDFDGLIASYTRTLEGIRGEVDGS